MDKTERIRYLKLISEKDKKALKAFGDQMNKKVEDLLSDIFTLTITTKYQGEEKPVAQTKLHFDGDVDVILPKDGDEINQQTLDLHQKMVDVAMKNRRELIRIFVQLFDLKDLLKLI